MVAPYFLPRRRVGALRPFKFAIHLRDFGWEPHIITIASDGELTAKEQLLLEDIPIYPLRPPFDRTGKSGSQLEKNDSANKGEATFSVGDWIDKHFPVDTWLPFFMSKRGEIKKIATQVQPDAIWSTGDPWSAHWVGKEISSLLPDRFWMADFRDPWTLSETNLKQRSSFALAADRKIERRWIQKPSMLSFTSNSTRELYKAYYADLDLCTTTIYNAFDRSLFNTSEDDAKPDLNMDPQHLNLIFFGRFRRLSPAKPIIDILAEGKRSDSWRDKIRVHSFGSLDESDRKYASEKGVKHCFVSHDPVPVEQGLHVLQQADLLLLSTNPTRTDIIPAKLWDYLAAGRPILSIAPNPEIRQILGETGAGVQFEYHQKEKVAEILQGCWAAKKEGRDLPIPFAGDQKKIDRYSAKSATEKLANILDQHTG